MARKKKQPEKETAVPKISGYIKGAGQIVEERIPVTLEKN